jgi:hypothetical protein
VTTIVKAISASPAMMTKPRRDDRRESAPSQRSSKGKSENNILPVLAPSARQFSWAITVNGTERNLMAMGGAGCCCTSRAAGAKAAVAELSAARRAPIYTHAFHHCGRLDQNYSRRWVSSVDLTERLTMITISSDASYDDHPEALCEREATRALALPNLC